MPDFPLNIEEGIRAFVRLRTTWKSKKYCVEAPEMNPL